MILAWVAFIVGGAFLIGLAYDYGKDKGRPNEYGSGMSKGFELGYKRGFKDAKGQKADSSILKELDKLLEEERKTEGSPK